MTTSHSRHNSAHRDSGTDAPSRRLTISCSNFLELDQLHTEYTFMGWKTLVDSRALTLTVLIPR